LSPVNLADLSRETAGLSTELAAEDEEATRFELLLWL
jgi:hypothetical protein